MSTRTAYDRALGVGTHGRTLALCGVIALVAHASLGVVLMRRASGATPVAPAITEYEIAPAEPPPPPEEQPEPPKPAEPAETSEPIRAPVAAVAPKATAAPPPAPAAKAGALLAAEGDEEAVSFVTDPNGSEYGHGTVAANGTASAAPLAAAPKAVPTSAPPPPPPPPKVVEAPKFARPPRLDDPNACKGYFPSGADDDTATVSLSVVVRATGEVTSVRVLSESPAGQGFGAAARTCLLARRFVPAEDEAGVAVVATTAVNVRFSR